MLSFRKKTWAGRLFFGLVSSLAVGVLAGGDCKMTDNVCEFWLEVGYNLTMMWGRTLAIPHHGHLFPYNTSNFYRNSPIPPEEVISADGDINSRLVILANGSLPGPTIEVYENQTVIIHVKNKLTSAGVTIHWHGLHQRETPWMDGVAFITQCPINPQQTFTYRFRATPTGTSWYHSHIGSQRTMGLFGAFIVRHRIEPEMEERILTIQDWNHDWDSDLVNIKMVYDAYIGIKKYENTKSVDGAMFSNFVFQSGLINGRGRYYNDSGNHNGSPLTEFMVQKGKKYRFRVIASGALYPFLVSVDNHRLTIISSDAFELEPVTVDSFIINPGERFDFILTADQSVDSYWIRGKTLEVNVNHTAEAILRYEGSVTADPRSRARPCAENDRCLVVNCPFAYFPPVQGMTCLNFDLLKSKDIDSSPPVNQRNFKEYFFNFAFPGLITTPSSINGRVFRFPAVSALTQPREITTTCDRAACGNQKVCYCTHSLDLDHGDTAQMVLLNMGIGKGYSHPVHIHGHSFAVLKTGYARYDTTSARITGDNVDIDCRGSTGWEKSFCNDATWSNISWLNGNVPGLNLINPPRKDTVIVPTGGYVVIRIGADNPGLWFMHCHIELHNMDGMAMVINESFSRQSRPPTGFPVCGDYPPVAAGVVKDETGYSYETFWITVGFLLIFIFILCSVIVSFLI